MNTCPGVYQRINKGGACSNHGAVKGGGEGGKKEKTPSTLLTEQFLYKGRMVSPAMMTLQSRFAETQKSEFMPLPPD